MNHRRKVWIGVGAFVLAGSAASAEAAATARPDTSPDPAGTQRHVGQEWGASTYRVAEAGEAGESGAPQAVSEAGERGEADERAGTGEGGEGGEGGAPVDRATDDAAYFADLLMMRGHLLTAEALLKAGEPDMAAPHLMHPLMEHYEPLEAALEARGVPEFEESLAEVSVSDTADASQVSAKIAEAQRAIDRAAEGLDASAKARGLALLLREATHEYDEGVKGGKVEEPIEYQDAYGFVLAADAVVKELSGAGLPAEVSDALGGAVQTLKDALSNPVPPAQGLADSGVLSAAVAKAELAVSNL